jgi:hypothetical protein
MQSWHPPLGQPLGQPPVKTVDEIDSRTPPASSRRRPSRKRQRLAYVLSSSDGCTSQTYDVATVATSKRKTGPGWCHRRDRSTNGAHETIAFAAAMQDRNHFRYALQYGTQYLLRLCRHFQSSVTVRRLVVQHWRLYCHQRRHQVLRSTLVAASLLFYFSRLSLVYTPFSAYWSEITLLIPEAHHGQWPTVEALSNNAKCQEVLPFMTKVARITVTVDVMDAMTQWLSHIQTQGWYPDNRLGALRQRLLHYSHNWCQLQNSTADRQLLDGHMHKWEQHMNLRYFQRQWVLPIFMCLFMVAVEQEPNHANSHKATDEDVTKGDDEMEHTPTSINPLTNPGQWAAARLLWRLLDWTNQRQLFYLLLKLYRRLNDNTSVFHQGHLLDLGALVYLRSLNSAKPQAGSKVKTKAKADTHQKPNNNTP